MPTFASHAEAAFRELLRALGVLQRVQHPYFARFGIRGGQWGVLRNLHRALRDEGLPGLRLTDLGQRLLIRPPSVTAVVDRLERSGLVQRRGSATDQRSKLVALTEQGRELVERVLEVHGGRIEAVMAGLCPAEQAQLHWLLLKLRQGMETLSS
jgi:DNA-binding MarR family transcriptional regulator